MQDENGAEGAPKPRTPDTEERDQLATDLEILSAFTEARQHPILLHPELPAPRSFYRSQDQEIADLRRQLDEMTHRAARLTGFARWALHMLRSSQRNASKSRGARRSTLDPDQPTIDEVIAAVVKQNEEAMKAKELWAHLYSALELAGHEPHDTSQSIADPRDWRYTCGERTIAFGTFQNKVSQLKKSRQRR